MSQVRTRFAPSPTGYLHLGNARTALLNWLVARRHRGRFLLRFEDTDLQREASGAEEVIHESLDWLGLTPDEGPRAGGPHGPYRQSERGDLYRAEAEGLLERGRAYRCYCSPDELEERRREALERGDQPVYDGRCRDLSAERERALRSEGREPTVRFRVEPGPVAVRDRVRGEVTIEGSEFGDFVILRSDGRPTYNFAVVVDDIDMEITHVIRGSGHLSNTPKQVLLYRALSAPPPEFAHIPLVLGPDGSNLSKREGSPSVLEYRRRGFHPDGVVNYLSLLSWSSESGREVLDREELVREVDLDRIGASDAALDPEKMEWLSGQHVRREDPARLAEALSGFVPVEELALGGEDLLRFAEVVRDRIHLFSEARDDAETIFGEPDPARPEIRDALAGDSTRAVLSELLEELESLDRWEREGIEEAVDRASRASGVRGRDLYHPLRAALTGELEGPELGSVIWAQGRERSTRRLRRGLDVTSEGGAG